MYKVMFVSAMLSLPSCRTANKADDSSLMSVSEIDNKIKELSADGVLDINDAKQIIAELGQRIDALEGMRIYEMTRNPTGYTMSADAKEFVQTAMVEMGLSAEEKALFAQGKTFAGTNVPDAVRSLLAEARLSGAVAYDVSEPDPSDPNEGYWSPYPQELPVVNNMAFNYTEITPAVLQADIDNVKEEDIIAGEVDKKITYRKDRCVNRRGQISAQYDEARHSNIYARGSSCQKWANNCGILSDGSLHCLPAARRASATGSLAGLILTNPSLARGKRMLFNGHIEAQNGVITSIGMSGRIAKRAARNQFAFIDPVPLLKAWGFKVSPNLRTYSEHAETQSSFVSDPKTFTVRGK